MMKVTFVALCIAATFPMILCAPSQDIITDLPGLPEPAPFKQYSGYLSAPPDKYLHYWFVESQGSPRDDPLVLWLNGGPGCSSMTGLLEELGPFRIGTDGKSIKENYKYSWNKIANVLFIESPAGVGYSYSDSGNFTTGDYQTYEDNFAALEDFFRKFPEYSANDLYLTGESYAGVYIPTLAAKVVDSSMNFKGFAVGNGALDWDLAITSMVYYAYHHGIIGNVMWDSLKKTCCPESSVYKCNFAAASKTDDACAKLVSEVEHVTWEIGLNPYNLFGVCEGGVPDADGLLPGLSSPGRRVYALPAPVPTRTRGTPQYLRTLQESANDDVEVVLPCTNTTATETFMNNPDVREALHVSDVIEHWTSCSTEVSATYRKEFVTTRDEFHKVLQKGHRILIYNGDADMACNFLGNEWFLETLNLKSLSDLDAWYYQNERGENQVAGFYKRYEQLDFVTIKGSGHFVPKDKPQQAFAMFERFLNGKL